MIVISDALLKELKEVAMKAKTITLRDEWYDAQDLIARNINRTGSYFIAYASPDMVLALIEELEKGKK